MSKYFVQKVRKHWAENGDHEHIIGGITSANVFYSNAEVARSIEDRNE